MVITKYIHKIIPDICLKILKATLPRALQPQDTQCFLVGIGRLTDLQNAIYARSLMWCLMAKSLLTMAHGLMSQQKKALSMAMKSFCTKV